MFTRLTVATASAAVFVVLWSAAILAAGVLTPGSAATTGHALPLVGGLATEHHITTAERDRRQFATERAVGGVWRQRVRAEKQALADAEAAAEAEAVAVAAREPAAQPTPAEEPVSNSAATPPPTPEPPPTPLPARSSSNPVPAGAVTGVGDSLMLSASAPLQSIFGSRITIDAVPARQVAPGLDRVRELAAAGALGDTVVVHLGTNGTFDRSQLTAMMQAMAGVERVFFMNVKVPRTWEDSVNATIAWGVGAHSNAYLIDWNAVVSADPGRLLLDDGYHLTPAGRQQYANLISWAVG